MIAKEPAGNTGMVRVTFELRSAPWVDRVNLVGAFNDWDTTVTRMTRCVLDGTWRVSLELDVGRRYSFRYLVNGREWRNDWYADDYQENSYGSRDSVVDLVGWNPS